MASLSINKFGVSSFGLIRVGIIFSLSLFLGPVSSIEAVTFKAQSDRLQLIYSYLLDLRPNRAPLVHEKQQWELGGDLLLMPTVDNRIGRKSEKISAPSLVPRPRGRYIHPTWGYAGASWIPPLEVKGYRMSLPALEVGYNRGYGQWLFGVRGNYSAGEVTGAITDSDTADDFSFNRTGVDLSTGYRYKSWVPYIGGGRGHLNTELDIKVDGVTMNIDHHSYPYLFLGVSYLRGEKWSFNFEQYQTESFLRHLAVSMTYSFN